MTITRSERALELAREAVEREGCRVLGEVGAVRFFSLRGVWFRWSVGLWVVDAATNESLIGHACVMLAERSERVINLWIPPRGGHRIHDPFWQPPGALARR